MAQKLCKLQIYLSLELHFKYLKHQYTLYKINLPKYYSETTIKVHFFCIIAKAHHLLQTGFILIQHGLYQ